MKDCMVYAIESQGELARLAASRLGGTVGGVEYHRFPDGEVRLRVLDEPLGRRAVILASLREPDVKVLPLIFLAATLKDLGAKDVTLIAPYLAYMRQDKRFRPGEAVSQPIFAKVLSQWVDAVVTVDPHLHRVARLEEVYPIPCQTLHAAPLLAEWILLNIQNPFLVGPDSESEQWVRQVAEGAGAPFCVLEKTRRGDREVEIALPDVSAHRGRTPVLVDDIVSSGRTMAVAARNLAVLGFRGTACVAVHAVFAEGALEAMREAGIGRIVTVNTCPHETNGIDFTPLLDNLNL